MKVVVLTETNGCLEFIKDELKNDGVRSEVLYSFDETKLIVPIFRDNEDEIYSLKAEIEIISKRYGRKIKQIEIKEI